MNTFTPPNHQIANKCIFGLPKPIPYHIVHCVKMKLIAYVKMHKEIKQYEVSQQKMHVWLLLNIARQKRLL